MATQNRGRKEKPYFEREINANEGIAGEWGHNPV
jgi:hypothetical protein